MYAGSKLKIETVDLPRTERRRPVLGPGTRLLLGYEIAVFDFPAAVSAILGVADLTAIGRESSLSVRTRETDQLTQWHARFYAGFPEVLPLFRRFIYQYIAQLYDAPFYYQAVPTFRVHLPENLAVGEFHVDSDYGHPMEETAFWVPLTPAFATSAMWAESVPGARDFAPIEADPGQVLAFDSCRLQHGNQLNRTGQARVSFDFRCIRVRDWRPTTQQSVNTGLQFLPGSYYAIEPVEAGS